MKLQLRLNGTTCECSIGYSLLTAAFDHIKNDRHKLFKQTIEAIASAGSTLDAKESVLMALEEHIRSQVPTDSDIKQWLLTIEGQKFALIHGTRNYPTKLTSQTVEIVLDDMSEEEANSLVDAIGSLCFGSAMSEVNRASSDQLLQKSRIRLEEMKAEIAKAIKEREEPKTEAEAT